MMKHLPKLNKTRLSILFGAILIVIGLAGAVPVLYFRWTNTGTASASPVTTTQVWGKANVDQKLVTGFPTSISIPGPWATANMNVGIIPGYYTKSGGWTLTETDAQFAVLSTQPNNISGNTFIYGHYRPNVFAYLHLIKPGTIANVNKNNGYKFTYKFVEK